MLPSSPCEPAYCPFYATTCLLNCDGCANATDTTQSCSSQIAKELCSPLFYECTNATSFLGPTGHVEFLGTLPDHALCVWTADLRYSVDLSVDLFLSVNVTGGVRCMQPNGDITVAGYSLAQMAGDIDVLKASPISFSLKGQDVYSPSPKHQDVKSNYLVVSPTQISYWNSRNYAADVDMKVTWELIRPSTSSDSSTKWADITTIVAIVLVSFICCLCCSLIFLRLMQITRRRRIYMDPDNPRLNAQHRNESSRRVYDRLTSSRVSIAAIETLLPVMQFSKNLVEVGEDICTVCFET